MQRLNTKAIQPSSTESEVVTTVGGLAVWAPPSVVPGDIPDVIDDLDDVDTTTIPPVVGDILTWDGTNWVPGAVGSVDEHTDVDTTTLPPSIGNTLIWDGTNWVPGASSSGCCLVPLTTVVDDEPTFIWDDDNQLVMTEVA